MNCSKARDSIPEVHTVLLTPILAYDVTVICHMLMQSYDIFDGILHMTVGTDVIWKSIHMPILVSKEAYGPQECRP